MVGVVNAVHVHKLAIDEKWSNEVALFPTYSWPCSAQNIQPSGNSLYSFQCSVARG